MIVLLESRALYENIIFTRSIDLEEGYNKGTYKYFVENKNNSTVKFLKVFGEKHNFECNSITVLKNILTIGKYIEEKINPIFKTTIELFPGYIEFVNASNIDTMNPEDRDELYHLLETFLKKYGIYSSNDLVDFSVCQHLNISSLISKCHYIYQIFKLYQSTSKNNINLKTVDFKNKDKAQIMELLKTSLHNCARYQMGITSDGKGNLKGVTVFSSPIDIGFYELINTITGYSKGSHLGSCERCGKEIEITNRHKRFCSKEDDYDCRKAYDNERKKESLKKSKIEKGDKNGNNKKG